MKREGTSVGFPDYMVIVGDRLVFIELKRVKGSVTSKEQTEWLRALSTTNAHAIVAHGAKEAIEYIENMQTGNAGFKEIYYHGNKVKLDTSAFTKRVNLLQEDIDRSENKMKKDSKELLDRINNSDKWEKM
jgi:predicted type IV restriction endonuclease